MHEETASIERRARASVRGRFGFITMLLSLLVFVSGSAHAEPNIANYYLQQTKNNFTAVKFYYQQGRPYSLYATQFNNYAAIARSFYISAYGNAGVMTNNANNLYAQNVQTLGSRRCRNLSAQQAAVSYSSVLRQQTATLNANLSLLISNPLAVSAIYYVDTTLNQITITLINIEQSMIVAQCF